MAPNMAPKWLQKGPKKVTKHYTRSDNTTHDTPRTAHNKRRGSWNDGREEAQEPHQPPRAIQHTLFVLWAARFLE